MNHKNVFYKIFLISLIVLFFSSFVSAEILVSSFSEKKILYPNEVSNLVVKIMNNSTSTMDKIYFRIEGADNIVFIDEGVEKKVLVKELTKVTSLASKELKIKFKPIKANKEPSALFVYYGFESDFANNILPFVSGSIVNTVENNFIVKTSIKKNNSPTGEQIIGEIKATNNTGKIVNGFGAEMIPPMNFDLRSEPFFVEVIEDTNLVSTSFEAYAPINIDGDIPILIVYGYFDENGAHYFEVEEKISFTKSNRAFLALIGIIVLIIAVFLYLNRTKKDDKLKGSGDKK